MQSLRAVFQLFILPHGPLFRERTATERAKWRFSMRITVAVVIAGTLIAIAILVAFRWQISAATGVVYRLDRWTGKIIACELNPGPCYGMVR